MPPKQCLQSAEVAWKLQPISCKLPRRIPIQQSHWECVKQSVACRLSLHDTYSKPRTVSLVDQFVWYTQLLGTSNNAIECNRTSNSLKCQWRRWRWAELDDRWEDAICLPPIYPPLRSSGSPEKSHNIFTTCWEIFLIWLAHLDWQSLDSLMRWNY